MLLPAGVRERRDALTLRQEPLSPAAHGESSALWSRSPDVSGKGALSWGGRPVAAAAHKGHTAPWFPPQGTTGLQHLAQGQDSSGECWGEGVPTDSWK